MLLLYDVTSEKSFLNVREWVDMIQVRSQRRGGEVPGGVGCLGSAGASGMRAHGAAPSPRTVTESRVSEAELRVTSRTGLPQELGTFPRAQGRE